MDNKPAVSIYIGMALNKSNSKFHAELKNAISDLEHVEVIESTNPDIVAGIDVFGEKCVSESDICVFIVDYPSIELGMEIAYRLIRSKTMLVFAEPGTPVSNKLLGALFRKHHSLCKYVSIREIVKKVDTEKDRIIFSKGCMA